MTISSRIQECIQSKFPKAQVSVSGDEYHIDARVISEVFKDKPLLQRHRMVYNALGDKLCSAVHAFTIHTQTPEESNKQSS